VVRLTPSFLGLVFVMACSSNGGGGGGPSDSGASGGGDASHPTLEDSGGSNADASGTVGSEGGTKETACLAPPFVAFSTTLSVLNANGTSGSPQGLEIGFTTCAGFELTTGATGKASTQLTQGIAVTPLYTSSSNQVISMLGAEIPATGDVSTTLTVFDDEVTDSVPGLVQDGGEAAIVEVVLVADPTATGACASTSGVSLAITGHPEATVSYMAAAWPTDVNVASTTASADGTRAFIGGITGANKVQVTGTKSGCTVNLVTASQTGSFALVAGAITVGTATLTN